VTAVDAKEQVLHDNSRPAAFVLVRMAGVFVLLGMVVLMFGVRGLAWSQSMMVAGVATICGVAIGG
jgi:hypothetical protein